MRMRRRESVKKEYRREGREGKRNDPPLHSQPVPSRLFQSEPFSRAGKRYTAEFQFFEFPSNPNQKSLPSPQTNTVIAPDISNSRGDLSSFISHGDSNIVLKM